MAAGKENAGTTNMASGGEIVAGSASAIIQVPGEPAPRHIGRVHADRAVTIWEPYHYFNYVTGVSGTYIPDLPAALTELAFASGDARSGSYGSKWTGAMIAPDLFLPAPHDNSAPYVPTSDSNGHWFWVQTCQWKACHMTKGGTGFHHPQTGIYGLDNSYPYPSPGDPTDLDDENHNWWADDSPHWTSDTPSMPVGDSAPPAPWFVTDVNTSIDLYTYMMYWPNDIGVGHKWAPVRRLYWYWTSNGTYAPGTWVAGTTHGQTVGTGDIPWKFHPIWETVILNQSLVND